MKRILTPQACIGLLAALVLVALLAAKLEQKNKITSGQISLPESTPLSPQHALIEQALQTPEAILPESQSESSVETEMSVLPVEGAPLPTIWDSAPAPDVAAAQLSPALRRAMAVSEPLSHPEYIEHDSVLNRQRVAELREIRQKRLADSGFKPNTSMDDPRLWLEAQKEGSR